jgi:hypothetical protein
MGYVSKKNIAALCLGIKTGGNVQLTTLYPCNPCNPFNANVRSMSAQKMKSA